MCFLLKCLLFLVASIQVFAEDMGELSYSAPEQIVALTQETDQAGGIVNPLSGQPCLSRIDLVAKGAQEVILRRVFVSQHRDWYANQTLLISKGLKTSPQIVDSGWVIFPYTRLDHVLVTKKNITGK